MSSTPRIWDRYLSERDRRLESEFRFARKIVGFGKTPALVLIDNYVAGLGDEPLPIEDSLKKYPLSCGLEAWTAVAQQRRLLELCRERNILVIHTNINTGQNTPLKFIRSHPAKPTSKSASAAPTATAMDLLMKEFTPQLQPTNEEIVILKSGASAFWGTPLIAILTRFGIDTLLICGGSTSGCVRATVVDASMHYFHTIVVEECVYDRSEASHAINLYDMDQKYAQVKGLEEVLAWVRSFGASE